MQKALIISGIVLLAAGLAWPLIQKAGFGRLPGDVAVKGQGWSVYFPVTTMIIISVMLTVALNLIPRLFK